MLGARLAISIASLVAVLGTLESLARHQWKRENARLLDLHREGFEREADPSRLVLFDLIRVSDDPEIVYELRPGVAGRFFGADYRCNRHGMRGPEVEIQKPPGTYRIAFLGDSFTFGWGVKEEARFASMVPGLLGPSMPGKRVESLAFGVPGYNTAMEAAALEKRVMRFAPDLVVLQFYFNDVYMPNILTKRPPPPASCLVDWVERRLEGKTAQAGEVGVAFNPEAHVDELVPPEYSHMVGKPGVKAALARMKTLCDAAGIPLVVTVLAVPDDDAIVLDGGEQYFGRNEQWFAESAMGQGLPTVNVLATMVDFLRQEKLPPSELLLSPKDAHTNELGHRLAARAIVTKIREGVLALASR